MRRRLALLVVATTFLVTLAFLIPLGLLVQTVAEYRAVSAATLQAESLVSVVSANDKQTVQLTVDQVNASASGPQVTVFWADGTQAGPAQTSPAVQLGLRGRSFSVDVPGGRQVLVSVQAAAGAPAVITAYVTDQDLHHGVLRARLILALLGLVMIGAGVLVADRLARTITRPITELAGVSLRLARGDLSARATQSGPPEVRDVAAALNQLGGRIDHLLREERESAADLSHRLRTPLTALRLDAEALAAGPDSDQIRDDVDHLERTVTQVIADTRRPNNEQAGCDATEVITARLDFWSALAEDTGRDVTADIPTQPVPVPIAAADLESAIDALLGNIFAHTPDGTAFAVHLTTAAADALARLEISDNGPGFTTDPHALLDRGTSGKGSTGLGLDIAQRAARRAGGQLTIDTGPNRGARITLTIPTSTAAIPPSTTPSTTPSATP